MHLVLSWTTLGIHGTSWHSNILNYKIQMASSYINFVVSRNIDVFGVDFGVDVVNLMEIIWVVIGLDDLK